MPNQYTVSIGDINNPGVKATAVASTQAGSSLVKGRYYIAYTWINLTGETKISPVTMIDVQQGQKIDVTVPPYPVGAIGANIYISQSPYVQSKQISISTTMHSQATAIVKGSEEPPINSTNQVAMVATILPQSTFKGAVKKATTANTATQLDPNYSCKEVTVIALKANTGSIYIGESSAVSSTSFGIELKANESFTFKIANANAIWFTASTANEGVSYVAI